MSRRLRIHLIAATRPNFMKVAPLHHALRRDAPWADPILFYPVTEGTNRLVPIQAIAAALESIMAGDRPHGRRPELWDGRIAEREVYSLIAS